MASWVFGQVSPLLLGFELNVFPATLLPASEGENRVRFQLPPGPETGPRPASCPANVWRQKASGQTLQRKAEAKAESIRDVQTGTRRQKVSISVWSSPWGRGGKGQKEGSGRGRKEKKKGTENEGKEEEKKNTFYASEAKTHLRTMLAALASPQPAGAWRHSF